MSIFNSFLGKKRAARARPMAFKVLPRVEHLEDRCLPSASPFQAAGATFPHVGSNTIPGLIITIGQGGTISKNVTGQGPYDGSEDTYVGVVNNSGMTVNNLTLSGSGIFDFDGDGVQNTSVTPGFSYIEPFVAIALGVHPSGYEGPGTYFTLISSNNSSGQVNFDDGNGHGLHSGQQAFFSLEEQPTSITGTGLNSTLGLGLPMLIPRITYNQFFNTVNFTVPIYNLKNVAFSGNISLIFSSNTRASEPGRPGLVQDFTQFSSVQLLNMSGRLPDGRPFRNLHLNIPANSFVNVSISFTAGFQRNNALNAFIVPGFTMQIASGISIP